MCNLGRFAQSMRSALLLLSRPYLHSWIPLRRWLLLRSSTSWGHCYCSFLSPFIHYTNRAIPLLTCMKFAGTLLSPDEWLLVKFKCTEDSRTQEAERKENHKSELGIWELHFLCGFSFGTRSCCSLDSLMRYSSCWGGILPPSAQVGVCTDISREQNSSWNGALEWLFKWWPEAGWGGEAVGASTLLAVPCWDKYGLQPLSCPWKELNAFPWLQRASLPKRCYSPWVEVSQCLSAQGIMGSNLHLSSLEKETVGTSVPLTLCCD